MNDHQVLPYCVQVYWEEACCVSWTECCGCAIALYAACLWHMMVQYCCGSGSTNKLFSRCSLSWQDVNEVILYVWLFQMNLEGTRLLELHSSVSVARGMSHHELNQTAVSYSSQFLTKQKRIQVSQLQYLSGIYERRSSKWHVRAILEICAFIVRWQSNAKPKFFTVCLKGIWALPIVIEERRLWRCLVLLEVTSMSSVLSSLSLTMFALSQVWHHLYMTA